MVLPFRGVAVPRQGQGGGRLVKVEDFVQGQTSPGQAITATPPQAVNNSRVFFDPDADSLRPPGWEMTHQGYHARGRANEHEERVTWVGPWPTVQQFLVWAIGYSEVVATSVGLQAQGINYLISRHPPAQHPRYWWMYASDYNVVPAGGDEACFTNDPFQVVYLNPARVPFSSFPTVPDTGGNLVVVDQKSNTYHPEWIYFAENQGSALSLGAALVTLTYTPRDTYDIRSDSEILTQTRSELGRFVSRQADANVQALPLANVAANQLQFTPGANVPAGISGQFIPEVGVLLLPTKQVTYTLHEWPNLPTATLDALQGHVNDGTFDGGVAGPGWPSHPNQTLLFQTYKYRRSRNIVGGPQFDIQLFFVSRPTGWNNFPARDGKFYQGSFQQGGGLVYQPADFNRLFTVNQSQPVPFQ